jgi:[ribosomal protein S5]-alanine N-acetyltransferase
MMIATGRLHLRPFAQADAARVEHLAGDAAVAAMTGNIPHPYPPGVAAEWIARTGKLIEAKSLAQCAVIDKESDALIGCVSLRRERPASQEAELAYWIGVPYWGRGFATEACRALVSDVSPRWDLSLVWAGVRPENHRSIRVLQKLGMNRDGEVEVHRGGENQPVRLKRYVIAMSQ